MPTITKKDLIDRITQNTQTKSVAVKAVIQNLFDEIISELSRNNRIEFRDYWIFETKFRKSRAAHNPKTLEQVKVPARRKVKFKMGRIMKEGLNGKP